LTSAARITRQLPASQATSRGASGLSAGRLAQNADGFSAKRNSRRSVSGSPNVSCQAIVAGREADVLVEQRPRHRQAERLRLGHAVVLRGIVEDERLERALGQHRGQAGETIPQPPAGVEVDDQDRQAHKGIMIVIPVSKDALVVGVAGVFFGVLVGWIIGSQQGAGRVAPPAAATAVSQASSQATGSQSAPALDESRASALKTTAQQNPSDVATRVQLGNLYFDAGRFQDAAQWYEAALTIQPKDANVSTDLGIAYYYMNESDKALAQFDKSLTIDPSHAKTLLNIGIVRAFGKQDLKGAADAWQKVVQVAPNSEEARAARQALDGVRSAHPDLGIPNG